jgi:hypothetical protein
MKKAFIKDIIVLKNFISEGECEELSQWMLKKLPCLQVAKHPGTNRLTTRYLKSVDFPKIAFDVQSKIIKHFGMTLSNPPPFCNGMIASYGWEGDACECHVDPRWHPNHVTFHCNILSMKPLTGGHVIVDKTVFQLNVGDMMCYPVSELTHGTTRIEGEKARLLWIFAFCVPMHQLMPSSVL